MNMQRASNSNMIVMILFSCLLFGNTAMAEEKVLVRGEIKAYNLEARTLSVVVEGSKEEMMFLIKDSKALGMLDDQLFVGDKVRLRYTVNDGRNIINSAQDLKSTRPGC
ncbi:exported hypothetical protein [Gammaproteobacteria bacterium]